jgi:hypothetical protein
MYRHTTYLSQKLRFMFHLIFVEMHALFFRNPTQEAMRKDTAAQCHIYVSLEGNALI